MPKRKIDSEIKMFVENNKLDIEINCAEDFDPYGMGVMISLLTTGQMFTPVLQRMTEKLKDNPAKLEQMVETIKQKVNEYHQNNIKEVNQSGPVVPPFAAINRLMNMYTLHNHE